ncbi:MAG: hypothetical protein MUC57_13125 [Desulfobacterales bacterium]|jgi:hypothetical protein|nr:hypothetical protein [Desulfobacterales bacterium]
MTKPVYFPHTYMSPAAAAAIRSVFPAVAGYEPVAGLRTPDMQALVESGFLEMVAAVPDDDGRLERALREFERWGRLQQGGAGLLSVFLSRQPGWDPLAADGTVTQIACEVRRRPSEAPPAAPETLRRTAVFLQLAHQADRQTFQVNTELQGCERAHAELLHALAGDGALPPRGSGPQPARFLAPERDSLLGQRVGAWARLFLHRPCAGPVFVTASPEVVGLLAERCPAVRRIGRPALDQTAAAGAVSAPSSAGDLMARLETLASSPLPDAGASDAGGREDVLVYAVPDLPPVQLFARLAESGAAFEASTAPPAWRHTVVVDLSRRMPS